MTEHVLGRTRGVQVIPYDTHLAEGAHIDLELLGRRTRTAFIELAAMVADGFPGGSTTPPPAAPRWRG